MPHGNDKMKLKFTAAALGGPCGSHDAHVVNGRRHIDATDAGQQRFQSLLFQVLSIPERVNPWALDSTIGRSFRDLPGYFYFFEPGAGQFAITTNAPARIAAYLLPFARTAAGGAQQFAGIPGLRVSGYSRNTLRLVHLPTGGTLVLRDSSGSKVAETGLETETWFSRGGYLDEGWLPVFNTPSLTAAEKAEDAPSLISAETGSALMARANIWWQGAGWMPYLLPGQAGAGSRLQWAGGFDQDEAGWLLTESPVRIPGARYRTSAGEGEPGFLWANGDSVEMLTVAGPSRASDAGRCQWRSWLLSGAAGPSPGGQY